jgi:two-component system, OmpR family, heavy metal sensor histidine kinase CusS
VRSIRLSLLFYFLGLLAIALGAASVLAYQTAQRTLNDKKETTEKLVNDQFARNCDEALLNQAQALARIVQLQFSQNWKYLVQRNVGVIGFTAVPNGGLTPHLWMDRRGERNVWAVPILSALSEQIRRNPLPPEIKLDPSELQGDLIHPADGQVAEYFQIDSGRGSSYSSPSLGTRFFFLDVNAFAPDEVLHWEFNDTFLQPDGVPVRRVILKASAARLPPPPPPRHERGPNPERGGGRPFSPGPDRNSRNDNWQPRFPIFIQCAYETAKRDQVFAAFAKNRDEELARNEDEVATSLQSIRARLLLISTITFLATVLGSVWLVRYGLSPLRRLSEAVSQVSTKDFRLPFAPRRLPAELKPIVEHLKGTLDMLKRAFAREKQATADISHELRTPLAALLTTTEIALRKPRSTEEYRELLQDCQLSAQQMNQAIDRMLALARLDAGVDTMRPQAVDVSTLAEQCAAVVRPLAEARHLTLTVHRKGPAEISADPDKLREILNNLLHNAIQYNRPNGFIDLLVTRNNGHLQMEVSDTGIGIPAEAREHIFERFYRADPSRGADGLHTGLGLAIVKGYVDLMGGSIDVESVEGQGSTFRVQLPVR